jgi:hypothetical protein
MTREPVISHGNQQQPRATLFGRLSRLGAVALATTCPWLRPRLFLKKGGLSSSAARDGSVAGAAGAVSVSLRWRASSDAPGRLDAHLFLGLGCTPCRWELSRFLNSITGRHAAKAKRELAGTVVLLVQRGAGLKGWLRESMCQAAIRILRATAALAELL